MSRYTETSMATRYETLLLSGHKGPNLNGHNSLEPPNSLLMYLNQSGYFIMWYLLCEDHHSILSYSVDCLGCNHTQVMCHPNMLA